MSYPDIVTAQEAINLRKHEETQAPAPSFDLEPSGGGFDEVRQETQERRSRRIAFIENRLDSASYKLRKDLTHDQT